MGQSPTTSIDNDVIAPARTDKEWATRSQDGACRLEPEKEQCSDVGDEADTRYGNAGSGLRTDASEPQYTGVIFSPTCRYKWMQSCDVEKHQFQLKIKFLGGHDLQRKVGPDGITVIWCRKGAGYYATTFGS